MTALADQVPQNTVQDEPRAVLQEAVTAEVQDADNATVKEGGKDEAGFDMLALQKKALKEKKKSSLLMPTLLAIVLAIIAGVVYTLGYGDAAQVDSAAQQPTVAESTTTETSTASKASSSSAQSTAANQVSNQAADEETELSKTTPQVNTAEQADRLELPSFNQLIGADSNVASSNTHTAAVGNESAGHQAEQVPTVEASTSTAQHAQAEQGSASGSLATETTSQSLTQQQEANPNAEGSGSTADVVGAGDSVNTAQTHLANDPSNLQSATLESNPELVTTPDRNSINSGQTTTEAQINTGNNVTSVNNTTVQLQQDATALAAERRASDEEQARQRAEQLRKERDLARQQADAQRAKEQASEQERLAAKKREDEERRILQEQVVKKEEERKSATNQVGTVNFSISPWGNVKINGRSRGASPPLRQLKLKPGVYSVEVSNGVLPPLNTSIEVKAGETVGISHQF